jgi:hypothetical protein
MIRFVKTLFLVVFSIILGCEKPEKYPIIPEISFKDFVLKDTFDLLDNPVKRGILKFYLIDGDGDIGLNSYDTFPPFDTSSIYYHNLFIKMFEKKNGIFEEVDFAVPLRFRIPYVEPEGNNKTLKADILVDLDFASPLNYDTVKYEFFVVDRELHHSNTETTGEIRLNEN